jgi:septal ring factor EnvC (AmiA/AmiB activator)
VVIIPIVVLIFLELIFVFRLHFTSTTLQVSAIVALVLGFIMGAKTGVSLSDRYHTKSLKEFTIKTLKHADSVKKLYKKLSDKEREIAQAEKELSISSHRISLLESKISTLEKELAKKDQMVSKIIKDFSRSSKKRV